MRGYAHVVRSMLLVGVLVVASLAAAGMGGTAGRGGGAG